ncbi:hypothetical protein M758_6G192300 [Ceratodon purpureus]|uniref:Uncharacterized protein n=1 Tax=Ceratodon purpureus TaxID=3225 RepID=A0A8T0HJJ9_CERPU|nr:hypothetical protein KC19_6G201000 [Ceratodon purpureus]KAG0614634.1 hypothetical protein M758_6G192300 [Ceratodon purpureus]
MGNTASIIASSGDLYVCSELQSMSNTNVTVTSLAIMQRPLGSIGGFQRSGKLLIPGLGQHEYIIVDLSSEKFILAEKLGKTRLRPAGIHMVILENDPDTGYCRHKCNLLGITMKASELIQILGSDRPDYNLFTANCWKYAFHAAQNILKRCITDPDITSTAREFLQNELQGLLDYEKNSPARYRPIGFAKHHPEYLKSYRSVIPIANQGTGY